MYPEHIPIDDTGYGPTGTGYRPSEGAIRRQAENKYRTDRNAERMAYDDPTANAAVDAFTRPFYSANEDPAAVRRAMHSDPRVQAMRDTAMLGRRTGFLGAGNPTNYSHNITRGITAGGFSTDIIGQDPSGRSVLGLDQRVHGNGLLAERVTQRFQKGLLNELYGKDASTDPSKLSGFDMEEASGVAATIMRRGGVGKAATWIRGADAQTRVDAARDAAVPEMRDKLANIKVSSNAELTKLAEATTDPKLKAELTGLAKSTDAIVTNDGAAKKVASVVREVTKGMAALGDMYGELSSTDLHQMLESVSGQQIVNKQQAKHATNMVNEMRNSAEALGMDPRAYADYYQHSQANFHQKFVQSGGFDERSGTSTKKASAEISASILRDAAGAAASSQRVAADGAGMGFDMTGTIRNAAEIGIDMQNQQDQSQSRSRGEAMVRGGLDFILDPKVKKQAEELLATKDATTDDTKRSMLEDQLKALAGVQWGGDVKTFDAADASRAGREFKTRGYASPAQIASSRATDMDALNTSVVDEVGMKRLGLAQPDATKFSKKLLKRLGSEGMVDLAKIANGPGRIGDQNVTSDDRNKQIDNLLAESGMGADESREIKSQLIDSETGRFKDKEVAAGLSKTMGLVSWGGQSDYGRKTATKARLAMQGFDNKRDKIGENSAGEITMSGIVNAMVKKSIGGADDDETIGLMMQAMKDEGSTTLMVDAKDEKGNVIMENGKAKQINALDGTDAKLNLSENISADSAERLTKVNGGKDLGLLKQFGFKDNADMAEKTKDPEVLDAALNYLRENTDLKLTGSLKSTTAVSDEALRSVRDSKDSLVEKANKRAGDLKLGGGIDVKYAPDQVGAKSSEGGFFSGYGGRQFTHMENNRKFVTAAENINSADKKDMQYITASNKDGELLKNLESQLAALKEAKVKGMDTVIARDPATGKQVTNNVADSIRKLEAAIARLAGAAFTAKGGQTVQEMVVTNLHVKHVSDLKKS